MSIIAILITISIFYVTGTKLFGNEGAALLPMLELGEDGIGVLLHRPLRQEEGGGDGRVVLALGHLGQGLRLP